MKLKKENNKEFINTLNKWIFCSDNITVLLNKNSEFNVSRPNFMLSSLFSCYFFITGFIKLLYLYLKQPILINKKETIVANDIVVETLASHHHDNYFNFLNLQAENNFTLIKSFEKNQFTQIIRISYKELFDIFKQNFKELHNILSKTTKSDLTKEIIRDTAKNLAIFSYFRALIRELKSINSKITVYHGGAIFFSLAADCEKVNTCLLAHGLTGFSNRLVIPKYESIYVYSQEELKYYKQLLDKSRIEQYKYEIIENREKKVVIFFNPDSRMDKEEINHITEIAKLFKHRGYEILARRHPVQKGPITESLCQSLEIKFCDESIETYKLLSIERPEFTVSFLSTSICQSLNVGLIPICVSETEENRYDIQESLYPFKRRSFFWNEEYREIKHLLENISDYPKYLEKLKSR